MRLAARSGSPHRLLHERSTNDEMLSARPQDEVFSHGPVPTDRGGTGSGAGTGSSPTFQFTANDIAELKKLVAGQPSEHRR